MLHAVIMAGGSGTRFWPASRSMCPKQLLDLAGDGTMIQSTVQRLESLVPSDRVLVVTNQRLVEPIREQLPQLPQEAILGEPCRRDTAPCVGLAAAWVTAEDPDAIMVVMPADHVIEPPQVFQSAIANAAELVKDNPSRLVTFGIKPTYPAESFGYVERGAAIPAPDAAANLPPTFVVKRFVEKPNGELARQYLASGDFYWNSGIFVWSAQTILDALKQHEPKMYRHLMNIADALGTAAFPQTLASEFAAIDGKSIDYAVMEKAEQVAVIEAPFQWDDVGSWKALQRLRGVDDDGNTLVGKTLPIQSTNSILRSSPDHLIATYGMDDCIIVHTPDVTLVARKDDEEKVRELVKELESRDWKDYL